MTPHADTSLERMLPRDRGLSRVEVLMSLVLIGVLISMLLTRLAEVNDAAKPARLKAAVGTVRAVAALFHGRCQAVGPTADCTQLAINDVPIEGVFDWPAASEGGIVRAAALPMARVDGFTLRRGEFHGARAVFFSLVGRSCEFVYAEPRQAGDVPEVDIVDASCN